MDSAPDKALSVNEIWRGLSARSRQYICNRLAYYDGSNVDGHFEELVQGARGSMLWFKYGVKEMELEGNTQVAATEKRKRDDGDMTDQPPASKKPKTFETTAPLQAEDIDIASPKIPFKWPGSRQTSIKFGQPTLSAAISDKISTAKPSSLATLFGSSRDIQNSNAGIPTLCTASKPGLSSFFPFSSSSLFGNAKTRTPGLQESECDEQFTFADRRSPQPYASHQSNPSAQGISSDQHSSASSSASPQGANVLPTVSAVDKPPFAGVDMSSLKIPANSNVSVTLNVFQAPSSLHQGTESGAARKLKCIQCNAFYMEAQNAALQCRRHTGMKSHSRHGLSLRTS